MAAACVCIVDVVVHSISLHGQVNSTWAAGHQVKARQSSKRAVRLSLAEIISAVLIVVAAIIVLVVLTVV